MRRLIATLVALALAVLPATAAAQTSVLNPEKLGVIAANCTNAQQLLPQQQKRDAVARINYGRAYEGLNRQIGALGSRFTHNKTEAPEVAQSANDFTMALERFKDSYNRYDDVLQNTISLDCRKNPEEFYNSLERARQERATVQSDIAELSQILAHYREALMRWQQSSAAPAAHQEGQ